MEPQMDLYCQAMAEIPLSINPHILKALLDAYRIEAPDEEISETTIQLTEDYLGTTPEELLKSAGHSFENGMEFFVEIGTDGNPHLIYADNNVSGIELVAEIIRRLLPPGETWSLTWVYYGSKLRLNSYDGGGVRVTASGIYWTDLGEANLAHGLRTSTLHYSATPLPASINRHVLAECCHALEHELSPGPANPIMDADAILKQHVGKGMAQLSTKPPQAGFPWRILDDQGVPTLVCNENGANVDILVSLLSHLLPKDERLTITITIVNLRSEVPAINQFSVTAKGS
jgi:hypothetical protein